MDKKTNGKWWKSEAAINAPRLRADGMPRNPFTSMANDLDYVLEPVFQGLADSAVALKRNDEIIDALNARTELLTGGS